MNAEPADGMPGADWRISGSYFESCNCRAICPCRRIDGVAGGRSSTGICLGALSWLIGDGQAGGVDLAGLAAVLVFEYDDDAEGSPWSFVLHVDERGSEAQQALLADILLGRRGGAHVLELPWVRKPSALRAIVPSAIEIDHTPHRQWFRIRDQVLVRASGPVETEATVTCVVPGHDRPGAELYAETLRVDQGPLSFEFSGTCAFAADFAYDGS